MMEKKVFAIFLFLLVLSIFFVSADNSTVQDKAYSCLTNKVNNNCASLSTEEKIFSLLAIGQCKNELVSDASNGECWPSSGCTIKTTAQAILALSKINSINSKAETWLSNKNITFTGMDWLLQVESNNATSCSATYSGTSYTFSINSDKTLGGNAGSCLTAYQNYWFKVSPNCYNKQIDISCSNSFLTSLLYKKPTSSTVYVSDKTESAAGKGTTTEQVESSCFSIGTTCDYEGTLWAALVLKYRGKDVSSFIPYLTAMADENSQYLPEAFLYSLTDNYRTDLLARQQGSQFWSASGDKFYDTAVALLPFSNEDSLTEKTNSQNWLTSVQGTDGCWQGNIRNTAFLLYSLWPRTNSESSTTLDCISSNNFCVSAASCSAVSGSVLTNYGGCFGTNVCCSKQQQVQSCSAQNGNLCASGEDCLGGSDVSSSDSTSSTPCCIGGTCGVKTITECEVNGGSCKSSCSSDEQLASFSCPISGICCVSKTNSSSSNVLVIVLLGLLIVLVALGIIFRKKLQQLFFRLRSGKGKPSTTGSPRFPPTSSSKVYPGAVQRRIVSPQTKTVTKTVTRTVARPPVKNKSEFDDVLKKLKEIGK